MQRLHPRHVPRRDHLDQASLSPSTRERLEPAAQGGRGVRVCGGRSAQLGEEGVGVGAAGRELGQREAGEAVAGGLGAGAGADAVGWLASGEGPGEAQLGLEDVLLEGRRVGLDDLQCALGRGGRVAAGEALELGLRGEAGGDVRVVRAEGTRADREGAGEVLAGLGVATQLGQRAGEVEQARRDQRVLGAEGLLADLKGTLLIGDRGGVLAVLGLDLAEVVEVVGDVGVLVAERLFADLQGLLVEVEALSSGRWPCVSSCHASLALPLAPRTPPIPPGRALPAAHLAAPYSPARPNSHFKTLKLCAPSRWGRRGCCGGSSSTSRRASSCSAA